MPILKQSDTVSVEPTSEPVTIAEARRQCDLDDNFFDEQLQQLIKAARLKVEQDTRRALITQTRVLKRSSFPGKIAIELPAAPVQSITSVQYTDTGGSSQTFSSSLYSLDANHTPPLVVLDYGESWPSVRGYHNDVVVTYVAGYGTATSVPETAKQMVLLLVRHWFDNSSPVIVGTTASTIPLTYDTIAAGLKWGQYP